MKTCKCKKCKGIMNKVKTVIDSYGKAELFKCKECGSERKLYVDFLKHIFSMSIEKKRDRIKKEKAICG